jgi:TRAP-type uncharacterized transport system substrate-binding protein
LTAGNARCPKDQEALMLSSIRLHAARKTVQILKLIQILAGYSTGRDYSWLGKLRPANCLAGAIVLLPLGGLQATFAQSSRAQQRAVLTAQQVLQKKHNEAALMVLSGRPGTTYSGMAYDIAAMLDGNAGLRLIVMDAPGGVESLRDLLLLRGIDLALVPRNVLDDADATAALGSGLREQLTYVAALYGEEVHVLAGVGAASINDLSGRKVAVPPGDGNAAFTVRDLLRRLQIKAEVVEVAPVDAIDDVRSGALAALVLVGGKPLRVVAGLPKDGSLHLLALPPMQVPADAYSPGSFGADDYPMLIPAEQTISTLSVGAVLVANRRASSDESSQRITRFVPAFFGSLSALSGSRRHPKWGEVNLAATLSNLSRFPAAQEWLDTALREQSASVQRNFDEFLRSSMPAGSPVPTRAERKQLFEQYLRWTRSTTDTRY